MDACAGTYIGDTTTVYLKMNNLKTQEREDKKELVLLLAMINFKIAEAG